MWPFQKLLLETFEWNNDDKNAIRFNWWTHVNTPSSILLWIFKKIHTKTWCKTTEINKRIGKQGYNYSALTLNYEFTAKVHVECYLVERTEWCTLKIQIFHVRRYHPTFRSKWLKNHCSWRKELKKRNRLRFYCAPTLHKKIRIHVWHTNPNEVFSFRC